MSARDIYHNHVKAALEKDGWTITHDPLRVERRKHQKLQIDLGAERLLGAEKGTRKIAVEIKSFVGASELDDLYNAVGQFVIYRNTLKRIEPQRELFLGIRSTVYKSLFADPNDEELRSEENIKLLVFNARTKEIVKWIPPMTS
jgi:hypothetical protein